MHFFRESRKMHLFPANKELSLTQRCSVVYRVAQLPYRVPLDVEKQSSHSHCLSTPTATLSFTLVVGNVVMRCLKCCGIFLRWVKQNLAQILVSRLCFCTEADFFFYFSTYSYCIKYDSTFPIHIPTAYYGG